MGKLVHFHADGTRPRSSSTGSGSRSGAVRTTTSASPYPAVSGEHAAVVTILADSFLEDLGSTNGTLVNGAAVAKHFLRDRDEIDIGQQILVYLVDDAATLEAPPRIGPQTARPAGTDGNASRCRSDRPGRDAGASARSAPSADRTPSPRNLPPLRPIPLERSFAADFEGAGGADARCAAPDAGIARRAAHRRPSGERGPAPALKVVSGAKAGRIVALVKDETLIGRAGVQVVALRRTADEVRVVPVEGAHPPSRQRNAGGAGGAAARARGTSWRSPGRGSRSSPRAKAPSA